MQSNAILSVYIDNKLQFAQYGQGVLSENSMQELGTHQIVVQAWASGGKVFSKTVHVSVNKEVTSTCLPAFDPNVNVCAPVNLSETKGTVLVHAAARSSISPVVLLQAFAGESNWTAVHFPIQKLLKIKLRMSSVVVSPVMASSGRSAP